jgi:hypothetical protein
MKQQPEQVSNSIVVGVDSARSLCDALEGINVVLELVAEVPAVEAGVLEAVETVGSEVNAGKGAVNASGDANQALWPGVLDGLLRLTKVRNITV